MTESKTLIKNITYNFISHFWLAILAFLTTPYIVKKLGTDAYGILAFLGIVITYLSLLDFGIGWASIKYISEHYARNEKEEIGKIIGTNVFINFIVGLLGAALIVIFTNFFVSSFLKIPEELKKEAYLVFYISALSFILNMLFAAYGNIPQALQRFDIFNRVRIVLNTIGILGTVLFLYLGFFLKGVVILHAILFGLNAISFLIVTKLLLPDISIRPRFDFTTFRKLFKYGGKLTSGNIFAQTNEQMDRLFIGFLLPIASLTYYAIPFNFVSQLKLLSTNVARVILPASSELYGLNRDADLKELYLRATKLVFSMLLPFLMLTLVWGRKLLFFWLDESFAIKSTLAFKILAIAVTFSMSASIATVVSQGVNRLGIWVRYVVGLTLTNLILYIFLIPKFGINGAAFSLLISSLIWVPFLICKVNNEIIKISNFVMIQKTFLSSILLAAGLFICLSFINPLANNLSSLLILSVLAVVIYAFLGYFIILDHRDREGIKDFLYGKN